MSRSRIAMEMGENKNRKQKKKIRNQSFYKRNRFSLKHLTEYQKKQKLKKKTLWNDIKHENCFQAQND